MGGQIRNRVPAHAEADHNQPVIRRHHRVDDGAGPHEPAFQAQFTKGPGTVAVSREVERTGRETATGTVAHQLDEARFAPGPGTVQQNNSRRHPEIVRTLNRSAGAIARARARARNDAHTTQPLTIALHHKALEHR